MSDEHQHETHPVNYTAIFVALCVCTGLSIAADLFGRHTSLGKAGLIAAVMVIATIKATYVLLYFMHIKFEGAWKYVLLGPTMVLAIAMPFTLAPDISFHYYNMQVPQNAGIPVTTLGSGHGTHEALGVPATPPAGAGESPAAHAKPH